MQIPIYSKLKAKLENKGIDNISSGQIAWCLDEWLDNENVCCFNVYTKDYFNANDKDMLISDNIKDDTNTTQAHTNENYNNTQEIIPDNVIRIETKMVVESLLR
ncbi:hypothetical protein [Campylobacter coli]|uniref:hypothetical protein n=1 Tax=Campylobacter coli TaxID=195 RepID=UPI0011A815B8|nr:hypothetical protein [Campylobacter coli]